MKLVTAVVFLLATTSAHAKDACIVELVGGLRITKTALEFTEGDKPRYKIMSDQTLVINDRPLSLNQQQQLLVKQYASGIRALVPEVHQLTLEGVDLASEAMGLVFQELLEPDNQTARKVHNEFLLLRNDIGKSFASEKPININQKGLQDGDFLGMDFESRISKIVDASGKEISWNIIKSLGASIFSNDDKMGDFETRMNKFGERMEREMNVRAEKMEKRGDAVCLSVLALDRKEEELKQSIKEVSGFNLIAFKKTQQAQR
jgi:hypothetical protein